MLLLYMESFGGLWGGGGVAVLVQLVVGVPAQASKGSSLVTAHWPHNPNFEAACSQCQTPPAALATPPPELPPHPLSSRRGSCFDFASPYGAPAEMMLMR